MGQQDSRSFAGETLVPVIGHRAVSKIGRRVVPRGNPQAPPANEGVTYEPHPVAKTACRIRARSTPLSPLLVNLGHGSRATRDVAHDLRARVERYQQSSVRIGDCGELKTRAMQVGEHTNSLVLQSWIVICATAPARKA